VAVAGAPGLILVDHVHLPVGRRRRPSRRAPTQFKAQITPAVGLLPRCPTSVRPPPKLALAAAGHSAREVGPGVSRAYFGVKDFPPFLVGFFSASTRACGFRCGPDALFS